MAAAAPNPATPIAATSTVARASTTAAAQTTQARASSAAAAATSGTASRAAASPSSAAGVSRPGSSAAPAPASSSASASRAASSSPAPVSSAPASSVTSATASLSASQTSIRASSSTSASIGGTIDASNASSSTSSNKLSSGAIGGIAGGAAGGLLLAVLLFVCWRKRRHQGERVPPPPPRDMAYSSTARARTVSGAMNGSTANRASMMNRDSSYNTLLAGPHNGLHTQSSFYSSYPVGTPSTMAGPTVGDSPPLVPSDESAATTGPPTGGSSTPMYPQHLGHGAPYAGAAAAGMLPMPTHSPVRSSFHDDGRCDAPRAKRIPSIDRLRAQSRGDGAMAGPSGSGDMTGVGTGPLAPGPQPYAAAATGLAAPFSGPSSGGVSGTSTPPSPTRSSSPHLSNTYTPRSQHSVSGRFPRPDSMHSLASRTGSNYIHIGPAGGAPHQGRPIRLAMPAPLSGSSQNLYQQHQAGHGHSQSLGRRPNSVADLDALRFASQANGRYPVPGQGYGQVGDVDDFGARDRVASMPGHQRAPSSPGQAGQNRFSVEPSSGYATPPSPTRMQQQAQPGSPRSPAKASLRRTGSTGSSDNWVQTNHYNSTPAGLPGIESRRGSEAV